MNPGAAGRILDYGLALCRSRGHQAGQRTVDQLLLGPEGGYCSRTYSTGTLLSTAVNYEFRINFQGGLELVHIAVGRYMFRG